MITLKLSGRAYWAAEYYNGELYDKEFAQKNSAAKAVQNPKRIKRGKGETIELSFDNLDDATSFVDAIHVTGDIGNWAKGNAEYSAREYADFRAMRRDAVLMLKQLHNQGVKVGLQCPS